MVKEVQNSHARRTVHDFTICYMHSLHSLMINRAHLHFSIGQLCILGYIYTWDYLGTFSQFCRGMGQANLGVAATTQESSTKWWITCPNLPDIPHFSIPNYSASLSKRSKFSRNWFQNPGKCKKKTVSTFRPSARRSTFRRATDNVTLLQGALSAAHALLPVKARSGCWWASGGLCRAALYII